jgi:N12 class adenine-specific DNA methylase
MPPSWGNVTAMRCSSQLGDTIFEHPSEGWQTADEYLSGFVIDKLEEAQAAAAR